MSCSSACWTQTTGTSSRRALSTRLDTFATTASRSCARSTALTCTSTTSSAVFGRFASVAMAARTLDLEDELVGGRRGHHVVLERRDAHAEQPHRPRRARRRAAARARRAVTRRCRSCGASIVRARVTVVQSSRRTLIAIVRPRASLRCRPSHSSLGEAARIASSSRGVGDVVVEGASRSSATSPRRSRPASRRGSTRARVQLARPCASPKRCREPASGGPAASPIVAMPSSARRSAVFGPMPWSEPRRTRPRSARRPARAHMRDEARRLARASLASWRPGASARRRPRRDPGVLAHLGDQLAQRRAAASRRR